MKKTFHAAIAVVSLFMLSSEAEADLTYTELGCRMLSSSITAGLGAMAVSANPGIAGVALGGGLLAGIGATTYFACGQTVNMLVTSYEIGLRRLGYKLTWGSLPWPERAACQVGDPSCFPQPSAETPGADPELDLFIQQSWEVVRQAVLAVSDDSTGVITTTTSAYAFAQQLESSYHEVGLVPGFAAPADHDAESMEAW